MPPKQGKKGGGANSSKAGPSSSAAWSLPKSVINPEHHHTLNHLGQVSSFYATLAAWGQEADASLSQPQPSSSPRGHSSLALQSLHQQKLISLSKKAVIRLDTSLKRSTCRKCSTTLIEGLTLQVRNQVSGPHDHVIKRTCRVCGASRRLPAPDQIPPFLKSGDKQDSKRAIPTDSPKRLSQRKRRKIGKIKRGILAGQPRATNQDLKEAGEATEPLRSETRNLSRKQRSEARRARKNRQTSMDGPSSLKEATEIPTATTQSGRTCRPNLPSFSERVEGSGWDSSLKELKDLVDAESRQQPSRIEDPGPGHHGEEYAATALTFFTQAAHARGDHVVMRGVGRNGAVGASLP